MERDRLCPSPEKLVRVADGSGDAVELEALAAHAKACTSCARLVAALKALPGDFESLRRRESPAALPSDCPNEETLALFAEGALAQENVEAFRTHLAECDVCLRTVTACLRVLATPERDTRPSAALAERLWRTGVGVVSGQKTSRPGRARIYVRKAARSRRDRLLFLGRVAWVAAVVVLGLLLFWLKAPSSPGPGGARPLPSLSKVIRVVGVAHRHRKTEGGSALLRNLLISPDDEVRTETGRAEIRLVNGGTLWLDHRTSVVFAMPSAVRLREGRALFDVPPLEREFKVETAHGTVAVLGTRFEVDVTAKTARVAVVEGSVECRTDKGTQCVSTGKLSEMSADGTPSPPVDIGPDEPGTWIAGLLPAGPNLVRNGGAEEVGPDGLPRHWNAYVAGEAHLWGTTDQVPHGGERAAFMRFERPDPSGIFCGGLVAGDSDGYEAPRACGVSPDTTYRLSGWVCGRGFKRKLVLQVWGFDEKGRSRDRKLGGVSILPTDEWTYCETFIKTGPKTRRAVPILFIYGKKDRDIVPGATVYLDDVEMRRIGEQTNRLGAEEENP